MGNLIELCNILSKTEPADLPSKIEPILDVDGALRFLASDVALINEDGYWIRGCDYCICQDDQGKFHVVPHDTSESFMPLKGGPEMGAAEWDDLECKEALTAAPRPLRTQFLVTSRPNPV